MYNQFYILFILSFLLTFTIFHFNSVFSVDEDGFFSVSPEDYYNFQDDGEEESKVSNQLQEVNNTSEQNALPTSPTTTTLKKQSFNIAVTADWGCEKDTKKNSREHTK